MIEKLKRVHEGEYGLLDENGVSWSSQEEYLHNSILKFCGCGDPSSVVNYIVEMFKKHVKQTGSDDHSCWDITLYEDIPTMFFLYWADDKGFIEHGTTIRCSWMSPKGDEFLKDVEIINKMTEEVGKE